MNWLELAKILIVFSFLLYACKLDLKSRLIPNRVWKFMLIATIPITAFQVYLVANISNALLLFASFGMIFMILLAY
ncbi:MAG: prepilin peptidase, partial [Archaeoglobaceae archaeon]|nr:prepilin peptidase [Archaeoglobaceae archaeon]MDW8128894.1 prepilin peptidase [Archaeoglobaceae archaeon]